MWCVFFQAEDGIRDLVRYRGLGDVYKRQVHACSQHIIFLHTCWACLPFLLVGRSRLAVDGLVFFGAAGLGVRDQFCFSWNLRRHCVGVHGGELSGFVASLVRQDPRAIVLVREPHHGDLPVSYTHLRAHETVLDLVCRLLL